MRSDLPAQRAFFGAAGYGQLRAQIEPARPIRLTLEMHLIVWGLYAGKLPGVRSPHEA
jgi:hypothetical protein